MMPRTMIIMMLTTISQCDGVDNNADDDDADDNNDDDVDGNDGNPKLS